MGYDIPLTPSLCRHVIINITHPHPALCAGESAYLSPATGGPVLYVNLEDHISAATGDTNESLMAGVPAEVVDRTQLGA